jgi:hypothetical protein
VREQLESVEDIAEEQGEPIKDGDLFPDPRW